jgi:hypothetical protein
MANFFTDITQKLQNGINQNPNQSLLKQQQINQQRINELLNKSAEALVCGPTCQKMKITEELKQKYLDAQTNLQTAPIKLEETKKNYYIYSEGRTYYDNMNEKDLIEKSNQISKLLEENFNKEVSSANTMNLYLNTALTNSENTKQLLKEYLDKNQELKQILRDRHGDILTNDRKTYYETSALERLTLWYKFLWYIYYIFVIIFILAIFLSPSNLQWYIKLLIIILLVFYPYYINSIVTWLYNIWKSIVESIPKNVYNNL